MIRRSLSCRRVVALITRYLDGALGPSGHAVVEQHLSRCEGCTAVLHQMRTVIALAAALGPRSTPRSGR